MLLPSTAGVAAEEERTEVSPTLDPTALASLSPAKLRCGCCVGLAPRAKGFSPGEPSAFTRGSACSWPPSLENWKLLGPRNLTLGEIDLQFCAGAPPLLQTDTGSGGPLYAPPPCINGNNSVMLNQRRNGSDSTFCVRVPVPWQQLQPPIVPPYWYQTAIAECSPDPQSH